jgi:hypothetical protein
VGYACEVRSGGGGLTRCGEARLATVVVLIHMAAEPKTYHQFRGAMFLTYMGSN